MSDRLHARDAAFLVAEKPNEPRHNATLEIYPPHDFIGKDNNPNGVTGCYPKGSAGRARWWVKKPSMLRPPGQGALTFVFALTRTCKGDKTSRTWRLGLASRALVAQHARCRRHNGVK